VELPLYKDDEDRHEHPEQHAAVKGANIASKRLKLKKTPAQKRADLESHYDEDYLRDLDSWASKRDDGELEEAWEGDPEVKQLDKYGKDEMTKDELCAKRDKLKAKENRTDADSTELRRINFALRSRQKGKKFGKVKC
tara:strand:- start:5486 stop:5899 length:414 start_codon:yes stop_codon:yes gene_type:complete